MFFLETIQPNIYIGKKQIIYAKIIYIYRSGNEKNF